MFSLEMATALKVVLHPSLAPSGPEAKYALRTLLRLAGFGVEFEWATDSAQADIYYGPAGWPGKASVYLTASLRDFLKAGEAEPQGLVQRGDLWFLDFGEDRHGYAQEAGGALRFASDIVFASYWLLAGAREPHYRRDQRDNFHLDGAFLATSGALQRPLVSMYAAFLRGHFARLGKSPLHLPWASGGQQAGFAFSHDVDYPEVIRAIEFLRVLAGRTGASRSMAGAVLTGRSHFWKFAEWIEFARRYGTQPAFYFSARKGSLLQYATGTPDCFYDIHSPRFRELFAQLRDAGCEIGLHASYNAHQDASQLRREKESLERAAGTTIEGGRHHYWRLNPQAPHETLARHAAMGMQYDSSLAFEFYPGFRRGVCHPFRPFHPGERRELDIVELPPTWMDDHFDRRLAMNRIADPAAQEAEVTAQTEAHALRLLDAVRSTGGIAIVDYHVRGMNADFFPRYGPWLARFAEKHFDTTLNFLTPRELAQQAFACQTQLEAVSVDRAVENATVAGADAWLEIRPMRREEIAAVAQMHFDFFGVGEMHGHSLANLGADFLSDIFYRLNFDNPYFFVDVAQYNGELIAFSVYVSDWRRILREVLRRHPFAFAATMSGFFLRRPLAIIRRAWGNLSYLTESVPDDAKTIPACYLLLGIKAPYRTREFRERTGRWVIGEMWERMERTLYSAGCREFWSAPGAHNEGINRLFEKRGAEKFAQAAVQGVECNFFRKKLVARGEGS